MAASLTGSLMAAQENSAELYKVGLGSVRFLMSVGDLMIGWLLLRQAQIALAALDNGASDNDKAFYEARSPWPASSPRTCCRCSPPSASPSRTSTTRSWSSTKRPSDLRIRKPTLNRQTHHLSRRWVCRFVVGLRS